MAAAACRTRLTALGSTHVPSASSLLAYTRFAAALPSRHALPSTSWTYARTTHASAVSAAATAAPIASSSKLMKGEEILARDRPPAVIPESVAGSSRSSGAGAEPALSSDAASPQVAARPPVPPRAERAKPQLKGRKAALTLTPAAVARLQALLTGPHPQLVRIGVRNKGCAGMSYHLEYVDEPGKFDEIVEQDGVRMLIDSKALFSIIGSEMDWVEDRLSSKFAFKNPNVKDACGCGESFSLG